MRELSGFIEVTALYDGRKALLRADCISAVLDNGEERVDYGVKPECRTIHFSGTTLDVIESYDDIIDMIWKAEL